MTQETSIQYPAEDLNVIKTLTDTAFSFEAHDRVTGLKFGEYIIPKEGKLTYKETLQLKKQAVEIFREILKITLDSPTSPMSDNPTDEMTLVAVYQKDPDTVQDPEVKNKIIPLLQILSGIKKKIDNDCGKVDTRKEKECDATGFEDLSRFP